MAVISSTLAPLRLSLAARASLTRRHRGPHPAGRIDAARQLVETSMLSYRAIAARTGLSIATISRHARAGGWLRPGASFGEEHYTPEGRRRMRRRALAERLLTLAEQEVDRAGLSPHGAPGALQRALRFLKAAEGMGRE